MWPVYLFGIARIWSGHSHISILTNDGKPFVSDRIAYGIGWGKNVGRISTARRCCQFR